MASNSPRTTIILPVPLRQELKKALEKRAQLAALKGRHRTTHISTWIREEAVALVAKFR